MPPDASAPPAARRAFPDIRAEAVRPALAERTLGLSAAPRGGWRLLHLAQGSGTLDLDDRRVPLAAPCLVLVPGAAVLRFRLAAGASGTHCFLPEEPIVNAIGHSPEAAELRALLRRPQVVPLGDGTGAAPAGAEVAHAAAIILREAAARGPGATTMIEAQIRALLVLLWRTVPARGPQPARARGDRVLREFRQLVELHFRERWTVARYAAQIGVAADRLNHLCVSALGKPPRQLVQERALFEARLMLERSSLSVEQVADALGYRSAAHFSRQFAAKVGLPPTAFRAGMRREAGGPGPAPASYADWP